MPHAFIFANAKLVALSKKRIHLASPILNFQMILNTILKQSIQKQVTINKAIQCFLELFVFRVVKHRNNNFTAPKRGGPSLFSYTSYLWSIYGVSMEYLWSIYGVSMKGKINKSKGSLQKLHMSISERIMFHSPNL